MQDTKLWDVLVIGGGAAGMMASGRAAELGASVVLLEKNPTLGKKLTITGGGRCNILNAEKDVRVLLSHYQSASKFLYSPFSQFSMQQTWDFFEARGLPLVVEAQGRAFPRSQNARDVVRVLKTYVQHGGVVVHTGALVCAVSQEKDATYVVVCEKKTYRARSLVVATGGVSHPETGSAGDGFLWLRQLGHEVVAPTPTLVPLVCVESWVKKLSGVVLEQMRITFFADGKKSFSKTGKILFTHFGLSGPLILNSSQAVSGLLQAGAAVTAKIDLFANLDYPQTEQLVLSVLDAHKNKNLVNVLKELVPPRLAGILAGQLAFLDPTLKVHSTTRAQRKALIHLLKGLVLTVEGLMGMEHAIVSDGGVMLEEVATHTMGSRLLPNLYLVGDMLNIPRPSGGYSLQLCWTTGWVAGTAAAATPPNTVQK